MRIPHRNKKGTFEWKILHEIIYRLKKQTLEIGQSCCMDKTEDKTGNRKKPRTL